ncbi:MAG: nitrous oxide-stimulated promoter family protein [Candidatus Aminicenantia bacterium]
MREKKTNVDQAFDENIQRDIIVLARFIDIYCKNNHIDTERFPVQTKGRTGEYVNPLSLELCLDCNRLLLHAASKRILCPYDPKPRCKKCPTRCYGDGYRERIKEVMRFSGAYLLKRWRLDLAIKYFF